MDNFRNGCLDRSVAKKQAPIVSGAITTASQQLLGYGIKKAEAGLHLDVRTYVVPTLTRRHLAGRKCDPH